MQFCGISWHFMEFRGISWNFVAFSGISWNFMEFCGIPWHFVAFRGIFGHWKNGWDTHMFRGNARTTHLVIATGHDGVPVGGELGAVDRLWVALKDTDWLQVRLAQIPQTKRGVFRTSDKELLRPTHTDKRQLVIVPREGVEIVPGLHVEHDRRSDDEKCVKIRHAHRMTMKKLDREKSMKIKRRKKTFLPNIVTRYQLRMRAFYLPFDIPITGSRDNLVRTSDPIRTSH